MELTSNIEVIEADSSRSERIDISVVMICFNHTGYIEQAIRSVLEQETGARIEIIIGDDCSTDGSQEIIRRLQRERSDLITAVLHKKNLGEWGKHNMADVISRARGDFIAFLEGDDHWIARDKLEVQWRWLLSHPTCPLCFSNALIDDGSDKKSDRLYTPSPSAPVTAGDLLAGKVKVPTATVMLRREHVWPLPQWYYDTKVSDYPLWFAALQHGAAHYIDRPLAVYRIHPGGVFTQGIGVDSITDCFANDESRIIYLRKLEGAMPKADRREVRVRLAAVRAKMLNRARQSGNSEQVRRAAFALVPLYHYWKKRSLRWLLTSIMVGLCPPLLRLSRSSSS